MSAPFKRFYNLYHVHLSFFVHFLIIALQLSYSKMHKCVTKDPISLCPAEHQEILNAFHENIVAFVDHFQRFSAGVLCVPLAGKRTSRRDLQRGNG